MKTFTLVAPATADTFEEEGYVAANPDVAAAIASGQLESGRQHFELFGHAETRLQRVALPIDWKHRKLGRIRPLLQPDVNNRETLSHIDCLTDALREQFHIVSTDNVSQHDYDHEALRIIAANAEGLVLDCGAGQRSVYYDNVVNYEIVPYDSTDVLGVAERLPFRDASFDAVICLNVLEHVKDPFQVARELMRVLKPGGELMCVAPFLQPLHGYPHHYFNMTGEGLLTLFEPMASKRLAIYGAMQPVWALNWFLQSYAAGLPDADREAFRSMTVADLTAPPETFESHPIVLRLSDEARTSLASAHGLFARLPETAP
ncbi:methyltransferase domain-containing protein [Lysobacter terrae]